ncbi:kinase-like protein [Exidia glandulosa HHB12029]|uniref:Kinase-like protein n=1 Tax=Exidia glandulosa HHB12029 TaxID=1314781 RepID=A0A165K4V2_EXIGL|nr:kinase-like protein [Exidia glandulosa HHB12029]
MAHSVGIQDGTILQMDPFEGYAALSPSTQIEVTSSRIVDLGASAYILIGKLSSSSSTAEGDNPKLVALKVFPTLLSDDNQEMLRRELNACRKFQHDNILPFLGTSTYGGHTIIVSYYMQNGNLRDYLGRHPTANRLALVLQVAQAVRFLHDEAGHVHGDLKCHNVLVSDEGTALLADFGLSTTIQKAESEATTATGIRQRNSLRFTAPELFLGEGDNDPELLSVPTVAHGEVVLERSVSAREDGEETPPCQKRRRSKTPATDVFAFGMLVLEVYTGKFPWQGCDEFRVMLSVVQGETPPKPEFKHGFGEELWNLCVWCWSFKPEHRPSMTDVVDALQSYTATRGQDLLSTPTPKPASLDMRSNSPRHVCNLALDTCIDAQTRTAGVRVWSPESQDRVDFLLRHLNEPWSATTPRTVFPDQPKGRIEHKRRATSPTPSTLRHEIEHMSSSWRPSRRDTFMRSYREIMSWSVATSPQPQTAPPGSSSFPTEEA